MMLLRKTLLALVLAFLASPALAQMGQQLGSGNGGSGVTVGSPISGVCPNTYVVYSNSGVVGCTPASAASLAIASAISGSTAGYGLYVNASNQLGQFAFGSSVFAALGVNVGSAGSVVLNGGVLGTPSSGTLTNATGLPLATGISGFGTGIASALGTAVGSAGAPVLLGGAGGTPTSLTLTNATGLSLATGVTGTLAAGQEPAHTGDMTNTAGSLATTVGKIGGQSVTLGGSFTTSGAYGFTATLSGITNVTFPTSGTLTALGNASTGSGSVVLATSPTLVTPALGTPTSGTLTNATGLPVSTGISGFGTGIASALGTAVGSAGAPVLLGGAGGTPTSLTLTNATGLPTAGLNSSAVTYAKLQNETANTVLGNATSGAIAPAELTMPSCSGASSALIWTTSGGFGCNTISAGAASLSIGSTTITGGNSTYVEVNNAGVLGEQATTGSGNIVRATSPTLVTPALGTPSSGTLTNATGLPLATGISGFGTGIASALGTAVGSAGAPVLLGGAGGTPTSLTLTNATGLPTAGLNSSAVTYAKLQNETANTVLGNATSGAIAPAELTMPSCSGATNALIWATSGGFGCNTITGGGGGGLTVGTTTITGGTSGNIEVNSGGVLGELATTGSGNAVLATSPTLVTPALGTPSSATLTNATGLPLSTGVTGTLASAQMPALTGDVTNTAGSLSTTVGKIGGHTVSLAGNFTLSGFGTTFTTTGSYSFTFPNGTTTLAGVSLAQTWTGAQTFGSGNLVLAGSSSGTTTLKPAATASGTITLPAVTDTVAVLGTAQTFTATQTFTAPVLGTPASATLTNATGLPVSTGISGLGTGVAAALAVNTGTAGSHVVNGGVLGTPSSGTLTNATGLPVSTGISGLGTGVATALGNATNATSGVLTKGATATGATASPSGPSSTSSYTMQGLAVSITPASTGRLMITINGYAYNASQTGAGNGMAWNIRYGTGTAPSNGGSLAGTQVGQTQAATNQAVITANTAELPFSTSGVVSGLAVGTTYWLDLAAIGVNATGYQLQNVNVTAVEL